MKRILLLFALSAVFLLPQTQCTKDSGLLPSLIDSIPASECDSSKVLYCNKMKIIINNNCATASCHVSGFTFGNFSNYAGIKAKIDNNPNFRQIVIVDKLMPQGGALTPEDLQLFEQWLNAGAPEK